jgi:hypothetical protein
MPKRSFTNVHMPPLSVTAIPTGAWASTCLQLVTDSHNPLPLCDNTDRVSLPFAAGE